MEKLVTFWEQLIETIPLMVVAVVGCIIQWCKGGHEGGFQNLILSSATAGFGSLCVGFLLSSFPHIPMGVTLFICGMIGYSGGSLVDFMLLATKKKAEQVADKFGAGVNIENLSDALNSDALNSDALNKKSSPEDGVEND